MNLRQLDTIVQVLQTKFKTAPLRWTEQQVTNFCEYIGLYWALPLITSSQILKSRSHTYSVNQRASNKVPQQKKRQIPFLDACLMPYEQILETLEAYGIHNMISTSMDINMYYQIQKLKIWSFIVLQYQNNREQFKKFYATSLFAYPKCRTCSAELYCACTLLQQVLTQIELFIKSIYSDQVSGGHVSFIDHNNLQAIIHQRQKRKRDRSLFINEDLISLLMKSIVHLPNQDECPLFWDIDHIKTLLSIIKHDGHYPLLFQNQIDGFVLLILVNPPFKDDNLFLKCLLLSQESTPNNQLMKARQSMISQTMSAANRYYQVSAFVHLLHHLLQLLTLTVYKSSETYTEYMQHLGQRKIATINWLSLYYFPQAKQPNGGTKNRLSSQSQSQQIIKKPIGILPIAIETRRQSKSYGMLDQKQINQAVEEIKKEPKITHRETVTLDETDLQDMIVSQSESDSSSVTSSNQKAPAISPYLFFPDRNLLQQNWINKDDDLTVTEFSIVQDEDDSEIYRGSVLMKQENTETEIGNQESEQQILQQSQQSEQLQQSVMFNQEKSTQLMQESVMMQSVMMETAQVQQLQESVMIDKQQMQQSIMIEQQQIIQQQVMQQSTLMQQSTMLQQSTLMQQSTMLQQSSMLQQSTLMQSQSAAQDVITMSSILNEMHQHTKYPPTIQKAVSLRDRTVDRLQQLSYQPLFDPFAFSNFTHLKLKSEVFKKDKTVYIYGATIGRNEDNTLEFTDHTKISAHHAKLSLKNINFYLHDLGSKGGTFVKITHNFILEKNMHIYVGNKFAFKVVDIKQEDDIGLINVKFEKEGSAHYKQITVRKGDKYMIGREKGRNHITFAFSQCNKLLSARHMDIVYDYNCKLDQTKLTINDLDSKNGTWLRLSDKQQVSEPYQLQQGSVFNLCFDLFFEVTEVVVNI